MIGTTELFVILAIVLVLFGGSKLPQVGAAMGQAIANFKKSLNTDDETPPETPKSGEGETQKTERRIG